MYEYSLNSLNSPDGLKIHPIFILMHLLS